MNNKEISNDEKVSQENPNKIEERNNEKKGKTSYIALGLCFGVAFGIIIGLSLFHNIGIGLPIGIGIGVAVGAALDSKKNKKN